MEWIVGAVFVLWVCCTLHAVGRKWSRSGRNRLYCDGYLPSGGHGF